jgi:Holliday junction DNA helicase RuvA
MFSFISGTVAAKNENSVVIENNGMGYELVVSDYTLQKCFEGENISLFCHLNVRDDGVSLLGFWDNTEKQIFLKLITVSGVGPKVAFSALSGLPVNDLALAILTGDVRTLSTIKGLGKKTAERIILELKEKMSEHCSARDAENVPFAKVPNEVIDALTYLGFSRAAAVLMTNKIDTAEKTTEQIITEALQNKK